MSAAGAEGLWEWNEGHDTHCRLAGGWGAIVERGSTWQVWVCRTGFNRWGVRCPVAARAAPPSTDVLFGLPVPQDPPPRPRESQDDPYLRGVVEFLPKWGRSRVERCEQHMAHYERAVGMSNESRVQHGEGACDDLTPRVGRAEDSAAESPAVGPCYQRERAARATPDKKRERGASRDATSEVGHRSGTRPAQMLGTCVSADIDRHWSTPGPSLANAEPDSVELAPKLAQSEPNLVDMAPSQAMPIPTQVWLGSIPVCG